MFKGEAFYRFCIPIHIYNRCTCMYVDCRSNKLYFNWHLFERSKSRWRLLILKIYGSRSNPRNLFSILKVFVIYIYSVDGTSSMEMLSCSNWLFRSGNVVISWDLNINLLATVFIFNVKYLCTYHINILK